MSIQPALYHSAHLMLHPLILQSLHFYSTLHCVYALLFRRQGLSRNRRPYDDARHSLPFRRPEFLPLCSRNRRAHARRAHRSDFRLRQNTHCRQNADVQESHSQVPSSPHSSCHHDDGHRSLPGRRSAFLHSIHHRAGALQFRRSHSTQA